MYFYPKSSAYALGSTVTATVAGKLELTFLCSLDISISATNYYNEHNQ